MSLNIFTYYVSNAKIIKDVEEKDRYTKESIFALTNLLKIVFRIFKSYFRLKRRKGVKESNMQYT